MRSYLASGHSNWVMKNWFIDLLTLLSFSVADQFYYRHRDISASRFIWWKGNFCAVAFCVIFHRLWYCVPFNIVSHACSYITCLILSQIISVYVNAVKKWSVISITSNDSTLWLLMAWCFSTRTSVATVLGMHPCVFNCLWVVIMTTSVFQWWRCLSRLN